MSEGVSEHGGIANDNRSHLEKLQELVDDLERQKRLQKTSEAFGAVGDAVKLGQKIDKRIENLKKLMINNTTRAGALSAELLLMVKVLADDSQKRVGNIVQENKDTINLLHSLLNKIGNETHIK